MKFDPLTRKLMQLAGMGAIVTVSFGTITRRKVKKTFEDMPIYKESVEILLANPHIQSYLGSPRYPYPFLLMASGSLPVRRGSLDNLLLFKVTGLYLLQENLCAFSGLRLGIRVWYLPKTFAGSW
ncbi:hypothetical protein RvY_09498-2 [Ramazzottius varieornatus]|uniref:Uncharacterized protein n=1 Tax=Ramazzottius varieornatus TaxID=947166 RepID=A0A1D1V9J1_RAMVA|nr:hypothetical protein RvY_09498-2 [Ramazzottius varieornatus]